VWAAPGRVNLIGEHTDYNDGYCLPFALPLGFTASAARGGADVWRVHSTARAETVVFTADQLAPGGVTDWAAYVAGVVWALDAAGYRPPGADLLLDSDLPIGAGLSSSAALQCVVVRALTELAGYHIPILEQARIAQRAENGYVGAPVGLMDQAASLLSTPAHALFFDARTGEVDQVPFDLVRAGLAILVVDTHTPHRHAGGEYASRRATCEAAARSLGVAALRDLIPADLPDVLPRLDPVTARRVRHVVTENARVLDAVAALRTGALADLGPLLTASHVSLRDDYEVSVERVDLAVEAALAGGAYGARMTGGGFGGCVIALVDTERHAAVAEAVSDAYADRGFDAPGLFTAVPSAGACRLR